MLSSGVFATLAGGWASDDVLSCAVARLSALISQCRIAIGLSSYLSWRHVLEPHNHRKCIHQYLRWVTFSPDHADGTDLAPTHCRVVSPVVGWGWGWGPVGEGVGGEVGVGGWGGGGLV